MLQMRAHAKEAENKKRHVRWSCWWWLPEGCLLFNQ